MTTEAKYKKAEAERMARQIVMENQGASEAQLHRHTAAFNRALIEAKDYEWALAFGGREMQDRIAANYERDIKILSWDPLL